MLSIADFNQWFQDYRTRWPAVGEYLKRQDSPSGLRDGWHQTLVRFDRNLLDRVTESIVNGHMEPVQNVDLGAFAVRIRELCRRIQDEDHQEHIRREQQRKHLEQRAGYQPLIQGNMAFMRACCIAAHQLLAEKTGIPFELDVARYQSPGFRMRTPADAAVVLADDHTDIEARDAHAILERSGLTWEGVRIRALGKDGPESESDLTDEPPW